LDTALSHAEPSPRHAGASLDLTPLSRIVTQALAAQLNVNVTIERELGSQRTAQDGRPVQYIWLLTHIISGQPDLAGTSHDTLRYFTWSELKLKTDLSPLTRNLVAAEIHGTDLSSQSKLRRIRNEQLIMEANRHAKDLAAHIMDAPAKALLPLTFTCECSDLGCTEPIEMSADEYAVAHQYADHFVIKPGHEQLDIERVVSAHPDPANPKYCIIEKYLVGLQANRS
jgi:hypothetical protein